MKLIVFICIPLCAILCFGQTPWTGTDEARALLRAGVDRQWPLFAGNDLKKGTGARETMTLLLNSVAVDAPDERIMKLIAWLKRFQELNEKSKGHMNMFWYWGDTEVKDRNAVEFVMQQATILWLYYRDKLSPETRKEFESLLRTSLVGVRKHGVRLSYSNIILMKIWNLIALGEILSDKDATEEGYRTLNEWLAFTYQNGITEYLSPTYYAVDMENLVLIHKYAKRADARDAAKAALIYLWTDIMANWYVPSGRIGGAHSRDYDRLYGHGSLDKMVAASGFLPGISRKTDAEMPMDFAVLWQPPDSIGAYVISPIPRFIYQRCGDRPDQRASHFLGKGFSIASAEFNYWDMDKAPLVIDLGAGEKTPQINFFMDGRSDHYGFLKTMEGSGHMKALHLKPFVTSVQRDNEVLMLASAATNAPGMTGVESIVSLPADAEYWLNDTKLAVHNTYTAWEMNPSADDATTFVTTKMEDGRPVLSVIDRNDRQGVGVSRMVSVAPGHYYRESIRAKGGEISLYMNWYDRNKRRIEPERIKPVTGGRASFETHDLIEKAPADAVSCLVWIYSRASGLTDILIDDISFMDLGTAENGTGTVNLTPFDFTVSISDAIPIPTGATLIIRRGDAAAMLRPIYASTPDGPAVFTLYNDGLRYGALRLTAQHDMHNTGKRVAAAFWAAAADGLSDDGRFAEFRKNAIAGTASAERTGSELSLRAGAQGAFSLTADIEKGTVIRREGMRAEPEHLLSINGIDVGRAILGEIPAVKKAFTPRVEHITNGTFADENGDGMPEGWIFHFAPNRTTTFADMVLTDKALRLTDKDANAGVGVMQTVPVTAGARYSFSASVKGGPIAIYINWLNDKKELIKPEHNAVQKKPSSGYEKLSITETAAADARYAQLWLYSAKGFIGESLIRNASFTEE
ncbi:MAG: hypothetical protein AABZ39_12720 [Spirochaetota bacterium]